MAARSPRERPAVWNTTGPRGRIVGYDAVTGAIGFQLRSIAKLLYPGGTVYRRQDRDVLHYLGAVVFEDVSQRSRIR
jgi:hypothetical protein